MRIPVSFIATNRFGRHDELVDVEGRSEHDFQEASELLIARERSVRSARERGSRGLWGG